MPKVGDVVSIEFKVVGLTDRGDIDLDTTIRETLIEESPNGAAMLRLHHSDVESYKFTSPPLPRELGSMIVATVEPSRDLPWGRPHPGKFTGVWLVRVVKISEPNAYTWRVVGGPVGEYKQGTFDDDEIVSWELKK